MENEIDEDAEFNEECEDDWETSSESDGDSEEEWFDTSDDEDDEEKNEEWVDVEGDFEGDTDQSSSDESSQPGVSMADIYQYMVVSIPLLLTLFTYCPDCGSRCQVTKLRVNDKEWDIERSVIMVDRGKYRMG